MKEILKTLTFEPYTNQFTDKYGNLEVGAVIKTDKNLYLVGNINEQFGVCDDCNVRDEKILEIAHIKELLTDIEPI